MSDAVIAKSWWHQVSPAFYGYSACKPGHSFGPAVRNCYLLHYIFEGEGTFSCRGTEYHLSAGDIFVIRPGEVTTYWASKTNPWKYSWLGFHVPDHPECLQEPVIHQASLLPIFAFIRDHRHEEFLDGKMFSLTYELLYELNRDHQKKLSNISSYAEYARTYIEYNYMRHMTIQEIADLVHIERRYLTALFHQAYGITPHAYLMNLRLEKGREFLHSGFSVKETAIMTGFFDLPNFYKQYKTKYGINPGSDRG